MWHTLLALALLASPSTPLGQRSYSWGGKLVITPYTPVAEIGNRAPDEENPPDALGAQAPAEFPFRVYKVERVRGDWLWVKSDNEGAEGWVRSRQVIPHTERTERLTTQMRMIPDAPFWHRLRGLAWQEKREWDPAIADFTQAIQLNPNRAPDWAYRGSAWFGKKDFDKAIADYDQAVRLDPNQGAWHGSRGLVWHAKKQYDKAIADFDEAIRLDANQPFSYLFRGLAWHAKKEFDKAIADYDDAIRLRPDDASIHANRGLAWSAKKDFDKAIADYDKAIRLNPKSALTYAQRGYTWRAKKDYGNALADFDEAIRLEPNHAMAHNNRAWLRATCVDERFRDGEKAVADATAACRLDDYKNAASLDTLAAAYAETGDFAKAVEWQEKALKGMPEGDRKGAETRLELYREQKPARED